PRKSGSGNENPLTAYPGTDFATDGSGEKGKSPGRAGDRRGTAARACFSRGKSQEIAGRAIDSLVSPETSTELAMFVLEFVVIPSQYSISLAHIAVRHTTKLRLKGSCCPVSSFILCTWRSAEQKGICYVACYA